MSRSAWAKFATYISFHGGLFLGPMNDGAPFVEMFRLLISEEECELGVHIPNKPTSVEKIAADAKVPVDRAAAMLKHMSQKGACFERVTADGKCFYNITPFIPGFYEFVMTDPETKKNPEVAFQFRRTLNELGVMKEINPYPASFAAATLRTAGTRASRPLILTTSAFASAA